MVDFLQLVALFGYFLEYWGSSICWRKSVTVDIPWSFIAWPHFLFVFPCFLSAMWPASHLLLPAMLFPAMMAYIPLKIYTKVSSFSLKLFCWSILSQLSESSQHNRLHEAYTCKYMMQIYEHIPSKTPRFPLLPASSPISLPYERGSLLLESCLYIKWHHCHRYYRNNSSNT